MGVSDLCVKRNWVVASQVNIGLLDISVGGGLEWGITDASNPAVENLKFIWQSRKIKVSEYPSADSPILPY